MSKTKNVEKKVSFPENECSRRQWILIFILAMLVGQIGGVILTSIINPFLPETVLNHPVYDFGVIMFTFFISFLISVHFVKKIGKTSFKSFVLGREHVRHRKETLTFMGLYLLGILLSVLPSIKNISLTEYSSKVVLISFIIAALFTWFQTTTEEIWFRGIFARFVYGNDIKRGFCKSNVLLVIVSALLFTAVHLANPEVLHAKGADVFFAVMSYMIAAVMLMVIDLSVGTLEPGIGVHWLNNFFSFAFVSAEVSAGGSASIFVDHSTGNTGMLSALEGLIAFTPIIIYLIIKGRKAKENELPQQITD